VGLLKLAALASSSYMKNGIGLCNGVPPILVTTTYIILNSRIPFYRLPEAMAELPELQHPKTTSLKLKDIMACFRLKLWES